VAFSFLATFHYFKRTSPNMIRTAPVELVLTRDVWDTAVRPSLVEPDVFAVGRLRWQRTSDASRLLADDLLVTRTVPTGAERPPLDDWFVLAVVAGDVGRMAEDLVRRVAPKRSQVLVLLVLNSQDRTCWQGLVAHEGDVRPLDGFRIVGPAPLAVSRYPRLVENEPDPLRWSRTAAALGETVLRRVQNSEIVLVGAGRNGSQLAFQFAALGVRQLRLIDADVMQVENLDAMPGMTTRDVGRPKVVALARRLVRFRPDLSITALSKSLLDRDAVEHIRTRPADLMVTAVDKDTPRLATSLLSRETLTPHLDVATEVRPDPGGNILTGDARLLLPRAGCVACVGGLADRDQTLYELAAPPGALRRGELQPWNVQRPGGSLITINQMTTATAIQLWLDLLAGHVHTSFWQRLRWEPGQGLTSNCSPVGAGDDCPYCRR
jgi:hypothetical protein